MQTYSELLKTSAKRARLSWAALAVILIGIAIVTVRADDVTAPVAKAEPHSCTPLCGREPMPTQHRHSYLAGRVALDPAHPRRVRSLFCGRPIKQ